MLDQPLGLITGPGLHRARLEPALGRRLHPRGGLIRRGLRRVRRRHLLTAIVGWSAAAHKRAKLVLDAVQMALWRRDRDAARPGRAGPDETFRAAGLVNPRIIVPAGAHVAIDLINADSDTAHGLVVTATSATGWWMPMMTARPAFAGSALWFLGNPTSVGMHQGTLTFTATAPGTYRYLCPVPGRAQEGMSGTCTFSNRSCSPRPLDRFRSRGRGRFAWATMTPDDLMGEALA